MGQLSLFLNFADGYVKTPTRPLRGCVCNRQRLFHCSQHLCAVPLTSLATVWSCRSVCSRELQHSKQCAGGGDAWRLGSSPALHASPALTSPHARAITLGGRNAVASTNMSMPARMQPIGVRLMAAQRPSRVNIQLETSLPQAQAAMAADVYSSTDIGQLESMDARLLRKLSSRRFSGRMDAGQPRGSRRHTLDMGYVAKPQAKLVAGRQVPMVGGNYGANEHVGRGSATMTVAPDWAVAAVAQMHATLGRFSSGA